MDGADVRFEVRGDRSTWKWVAVGMTLGVIATVIEAPPNANELTSLGIGMILLSAIYAGISEIAFRSLNYVILKPEWIDMRKHAWGLSINGWDPKYTLPYEGILSAVASESGMQIDYHLQMSGGKYSSLVFHLDVPIGNQYVVASEIQRRAEEAAPSRVMWQDAASMDRPTTMEG